jgi:hypothetical protein
MGEDHRRALPGVPMFSRDAMIRVVRAALAATVVTSVAVVAPAAAAPAPAAPAATVATAKAATVPAAVRNQAAFLTGRSVTVRWHNPAHLKRDVVRYRRGTVAPRTPQGGAPARHSNPVVTSVTLQHLIAGARYSVSIWTQNHGVLSARRTVHFTTPRAAGHLRTFSGRITDTHGAPLAGAHVGAFPFNGGFGAGATTGTDGRYRLRAANGPTEFLVDGTDATGGSSDASGYVGVDRLVRARGDVTLSPVLRAGAAASGRVVDAHGAPVEGAYVSGQTITPYVPVVDSFGTFTQSFGGNATDAAGQYTIKGLPTGALLFCVGDPSSFDDSTSVCNRVSVRTVPGQVRPVPDLTYAPRRGGALAGRIVAGGRGVSDAIVEAVRSDKNGFSIFETFTNRLGFYRIDGVTPGRYHLCAGTPFAQDAAGYVATCSTTVAVVKVGATTRQRLRLKRGSAFSGVLRTHAGLPIRGASVDVTGTGANSDYEDGGETDAAGHFDFGGLPAGKYRVCFDAQGAATPRHPTGLLGHCYRGGLVPTSTGRVRLGVEDELTRAAAAISGRVVDERGAGAPGLGVYLIPRNGMDGIDGGVTDAHGRYRVTGLPLDRYYICVAAASDSDEGICRHIATPVTLGRVTRVPDLVHARGGSVTVTVHDATDDGAVAGANVVLVSPCHEADFGCSKLDVLHTARRGAVHASDVTNANGRVTFRGLPPGSYVACTFAHYGQTAAGAPATGYADACSDTTYSLKLGAGGHADLTQSLQTGGEVRGHVVNGQGQPVAGAIVVVSGASPTDYGQWDGVGGGLPVNDALTDANGNYDVTGVVPGQQTVCVEAADSFSSTGCTNPATVTVTAGAVATAPDVTFVSQSFDAHAAEARLQQHMSTPAVRFAARRAGS